MFWGKFPPKRSPDKTLCITAPIVVDFNRTLRPSIGLALVVVGVNVSLVLVDELYADPTSHGVPFQLKSQRPGTHHLPTFALPYSVDIFH